MAYAVFREEARDVAPKYTPKTVSTDGWQGTQAAWKALFKGVVLLLCFLHGWLKIRDRAEHLKDLFSEVSRRSLGSVPRPRPERLRATVASAPGVGRPAPRGSRPGESAGPVPQGSSVRGGVPSPRRPSHEQHARPPDAGNEPVLRPRSTPPWLARGRPAPLPGVGVVVELRAMAPGISTCERGLAVPGRATQPTPLPRQLAAEPVGVRVPRRVPTSTPPKSVTVRQIRDIAGLPTRMIRPSPAAARAPGRHDAARLERRDPGRRTRPGRRPDRCRTAVRTGDPEPGRPHGRPVRETRRPHRDRRPCGLSRFHRRRPAPRPGHSGPISGPGRRGRVPERAAHDRREGRWRRGLIPTGSRHVHWRLARRK